jgi:membrane-bound lytic murein transglycosylase MltF
MADIRTGEKAKEDEQKDRIRRKMIYEQICGKLAIRVGQARPRSVPAFTTT